MKRISHYFDGDSESYRKVSHALLSEEPLGSRFGKQKSLAKQQKISGTTF
jgi:hypothetical protein